MKILKFGGSSIADAECIARSREVVARARDRDGAIVVVVSALGDTTDRLVELTDPESLQHSPTQDPIERIRERHLMTATAVAPGRTEIRDRIETVVADLTRLVTGIGYIGDCPPAVRDRVLACGERLAAPLVAAALNAAGWSAQAIDGADIIVTDHRHGAAAVDLAATESAASARLLPTVGSSIPVVTGFIGATVDGRTTTLGRGGSDLTATVLGAALGADMVEIWTDVNGIYTAPPALVPGARPQPVVSFDEAAELARFGAAVLFSQTVAPIRRLAIPVTVRNTFDPDGLATRVEASPDLPAGARSLAAVERAVVFQLDSKSTQLACAASVYEVLGRCLAATIGAASGVWTLVAEEAEAGSIESSLRAAGIEPERRSHTSIVTVVGNRLRQQPWVAGRALEALGRRGIPLEGLISPSEHSLCLIVDRGRHLAALAILHEALMLAHLASRAASAARTTDVQKGIEGDTSPTQRRRARRNRNGRPAARTTAA